VRKMTTDLTTASLGSSQAPTDAVDKSQSALHTKIQTLPSLAEDQADHAPH